MRRLRIWLLGWEQQPLYYCAPCGGYYPVAHFCQ